MTETKEIKELKDVSNNFGNFIITMPLDEAKIIMLKELTAGKPNAIFINLDLHDAKHTAAIPKLIELGFAHQYTSADGKKSSWWIANQSPAPLPLSAVSSCFVCLRDKDKILVIADKFRAGLSLPGGNANSCELPVTTAVRELKEETDIQVAPTELEHVAMIHRVNANIFGANKTIHYYMAHVPENKTTKDKVSKDKTVELKRQEMEIIWAGFVDMAEFAAGKTLVEISPGIKLGPSYLSQLVVEHILSRHVKQGKSEFVLDIRQLDKKPSEVDPTDLMQVEFL